MIYKDSTTIRKKFLAFFANKAHKLVPSAPIVIHNDTTLMFTNAGMNQFKDFFLGNKQIETKRIADTQKCLRVSGKHNDLDEVGMDTYHHTMFEMLGNWSFGDYFKKEAIEWAWELLIEEFGLPKGRLYATIFEGSQEEGLVADEEARDYWKSLLPEERILNGNKKDNFWEMGDTGPCGPCSEIHIDLREQKEIDKLPGRELVNKDHPEVIEIWNLVFIQFNRLKDKSLQNLPDKHVDTGMGFERLVMAIQNKKSNYDTDIFQPLIRKTGELAKVVYGQDEKTDIALRVIADHIRAITFTIADGQLPSNNKAGYVIRRILRRAVRYGYTFLDLKKPFLNKLVPNLADQMGDIFQEIRDQQDFIQKVIFEEETTFFKTLEKGLKKIEAYACSGAKEISGKLAFELYDTHGFPIDLTTLISKEKNISVDLKGFEREMSKQKDRSKDASKLDSSDWVLVRQAANQSEFLGYDHLSSKSHIVKYRKVGNYYEIVLDKTPFYAESGGQVGDQGKLISLDNCILVHNTTKESDLFIHHTYELPSEPDVEFEAIVNKTKRDFTEKNHSCTHLLHAALRQALGTHVQQRGSLVNDQILRFDFSHFSKMTEQEIQQVESIVNDRIRQNIRREEKRNIPIKKAIKIGAMALFGEKYGEFVRVIAFDPKFSVELCGGTHVETTGQIGFFKIAGESSVAAGVRRIQALTAKTAEEYVRSQDQLISKLNRTLKSPKNLVSTVESLVNEKKYLLKQVQSFKDEKLKLKKKELKSKFIDYMSFKILSQIIPDIETEELKGMAFQLKAEVPNSIQILGSIKNKKPHLMVMIDNKIIESKAINAVEIIRKMAIDIKGGGGGQAFFATAGGKNPEGIDNALRQGVDIVKRKLSTQ